MSKFREWVKFELDCTENMLERAQSAANLRDQVSRAYYACYHVMIAAIWLKEYFDYGDSKNTDRSHAKVFHQYIDLYSKTKRTRIVPINDVVRTVKAWKKLRQSADYDIFTDDFEIPSLTETTETLQNMYRFVENHITYLDRQLNNPNPL